MTLLRQYLISITSVAFLCSIVKSLFQDKHTGAALIRLIAGLIMVLSVASPLVTLRLENLPFRNDFLEASASDAAETGRQLAREEMKTIINQQLEAYILDKANAYGASVRVSFQDYNNLLVPGSVVLQGNVSPYAKMQLTQSIAADLGIAKENQIWIG